MGVVCGKVNRRDRGVVLRHVRRLCAEDFDVRGLSDREVLRRGGYVLLEHECRLVSGGKFTVEELGRMCGVRVSELD